MSSENRAIKSEPVPQEPLTVKRIPSKLVEQEPLTITIKSESVPQEQNKLIIKGKPVERFTAA